MANPKAAYASIILNSENHFPDILASAHSVKLRRFFIKNSEQKFAKIIVIPLGTWRKYAPSFIFRVYYTSGLMNRPVV
nr:K289 [uncultured bacterium]